MAESRSAESKYRLKLYRGAWCVVWRESGATRRYSLGTTDRGPAETAFADYLHTHARQQRPERPLTIAGLFSAYKADRAGAGKGVENMGQHWKALAPFFGARMPQHVTKDLCREYIVRRRALGRKDGTIRSELGYLASCLNWAHGEDWIDSAPHIALPPPSPPRDRWLTDDEAQRLIDAAASPHIRLFIILALTTAARTTAILDLTWPQVNERFIDFNPPGRARTSKGRAVVPMTEELWAILHEANRACGESGHVIEYGGGRVASIKTGFRHACRVAGLERVTPHILRHTAASWMAMSGIRLEKIALFLGHKNSRMVETTYAKYDPTYLADAAKALGEVVRFTQEGSFEPRKRFLKSAMKDVSR